MGRQTSLLSSFVVRTVLILVGVVGAFLAIEFILFLASYFLKSAQWSSRFASNNDVFVILCLGESTTRGFGTDPWPAQLERILNERVGSNRFRVVNQGVAGIQSPEIAERLEGWIEAYKPKIIVSMMGINDSQRQVYFQPLVFESAPAAFLDFARKSRTFRLVELLLDQTKHGAESAVHLVPATPIDPKAQALSLHPRDRANILERQIEASPSFSDLFELGMLQMRNLEDPKGAIETFRRAIVLDPTNAEVLIWLGRLTNDVSYYKAAIHHEPSNKDAYNSFALTLEQMKNIGEAERIFQSMEQLPHMHEEGVRQLAHFYERVARYDMAAKYFQMAATLCNDSRGYREYLEFANRRGDRQLVEAVRDETLVKFPDDEPFLRLYISLSVKSGEVENLDRYIAIIEKKDINPKWWLDQSEEEKKLNILIRGLSLPEAEKMLASHGFRIAPIHPITKESYLKIAEIAQQRDITLIAMQYPRISAEPLLEILGSNPYVMVIDNMENFDEVLSHSDASELFTDMFGVKFGHLTNKGNRLIAERVANKVGDLIHLQH